MKMEAVFVTVVEHSCYLKRAEKLLTPDQMAEIVETLASNPDVGMIMPGTGGCRKMRYAGVQNKGKSGGVRVIHLFATPDHKVHLVDIYGKGEKANLTKAERNELAKLAAILKGD
jgi:hypothetical protein